MDYNKITSFFDKFKKIIYQKEETEEIIRKTISENISFEINKNNFKTQKGVIFLSCSPVVRTEIMIKKKKILFEIKNLLPNEINFIDIR